MNETKNQADPPAQRELPGLGVLIQARRIVSPSEEWNAGVVIGVEGNKRRAMMITSNGATQWVLVFSASGEGDFWRRVVEIDRLVLDDLRAQLETLRGHVVPHESLINDLSGQYQTLSYHVEGLKAEIEKLNEKVASLSK